MLIGGLVLTFLSFYAISLLLKVRKQTKIQHHYKMTAINKRNLVIFDSVSSLCLAGIQEQCELSEVSLRVCNLIIHVQMENKIHLESEYPVIFELYLVVKSMHIGAQRKELSKRERMEEDLIRYKAEARLKDSMLEELENLHKRVNALSDELKAKQ